MRLGVHVSIAGKIYESIDRAKALGCDTVQIFSRNPRGWKSKGIAEEDVLEFRRRREKSGIYPVVVHIPYIINLASPDDSLYENSMRSYIEDIKEADLLGADYFVTHMGSHKGRGEDFGLNRLAGALNQIIDKARPSLVILLEITAGGGSSLGYKFEHLKTVIGKIKKKGKMGVCFDTSHAFEAGYNVSTKDGLEDTVKKFDNIIGLEALKVIHLNDSRSDFNSHADRHWHIGKGKMGLGAFKRIVNHPKLKDIPFILETPKKTDRDDKMNMSTVRKLHRG